MDETVITPDTEVKDVAGTVAAEINSEVAPKEVKEAKTDTVPLSVFLELKDELKSLKHEIKETKSSDRASVTSKGISDLSSKYPDVSPDFIQDILNSATSEATKKIEEKYSPIIERQENEKKQVAFDKAFDNLYEKTLKDNPELPTSMDKDLVKELASTPKYRNVPLADILNKMYSTGTQGKSSSENDTRSASDKVEDVVNFNKISESQRQAVLDDPKARAKYFAFLDGMNG